MTGLEDQYFTKSYINLYGVLKEIWPYAIGRNPVGSSPRYIGDADFIELHGLRPHVGNQPTVCVNDGNPLNLQTVGDYVRQTANCQVRMFWSERVQGIAKSFRKPRDRRLVLNSETIALFKKFYALTRSQ